MNRYLAIIIAALTATEMQAFQLAPRLVVNIAIDQLRSDYMEAFAPFYNIISPSYFTIYNLFH